MAGNGGRGQFKKVELAFKRCKRILFAGRVSTPLFFFSVQSELHIKKHNYRPQVLTGSIEHTGVKKKLHVANGN